MQARETIRVFCVDGPCRGLHYVEATTGRILDEDPDGLGLWYLYRISDREITNAESGPSPSAYFDHVAPAVKPGKRGVRPASGSGSSPACAVVPPASRRRAGPAVLGTPCRA